MDASVAFATGIGVLLFLTFFIIFSTGSFLAVGVLWVLLSMMGFLMYVYEIITPSMFSTPAAAAAPATQPVGQATSSLPSVQLVGSEVFHIADNKFTYDDAQAVCAAYDSQLATLEQILDAYNHGAEWCGYGWSAGGMALYPTQKGTWDALQQESDQKKRTACGRPGVNGGYFDPSSKFGVNCYGIKPQGNVKLPTPLPGTDQDAFNGAVAKFKAMIKSFNLDPYSRAVWSGSTPSAVSTGQQFINQVTTEHFAMPGVPDYEVMPGETIANSGLPLGSPYGLRGQPGDTGPAGPTGPVGSPGANGAPGVSNVPGPTGPPGANGAPGVSNVPGPTGPVGTSGGIGPTGPSGKDASRLAGITDVQYGANGKWAPVEPARQAILNGMQDGQPFRMNQAPGVGDPAPSADKTTTIKWTDNAGGGHSAWVGETITADLLAALNRRFIAPGPAADIKWTGSGYA